MDARSFIEGFNRLIEPIKNRVMLMVNRGVVTSTDDSQKLQTMQVKVLAGETKKAVPSVQHFGFSSHTPAGSDVVMLCTNGNRENSVIIGTESRQYRYINLAEGDSIHYNKNGKFIHIKGDDIDMNLNKLSIRNDSNELVAVLSDFMQEVLDGETITALGPSPLTPATKVKIEAVKAKLDSFKV